MTAPTSSRATSEVEKNTTKNFTRLFIIVAITSITGKGLRRFPDILSAGFDVLWDMAILIPLLFLAAAAQTVKVDQFPLRSGCGESDPVVARLHAGDPVQVKFS